MYPSLRPRPPLLSLSLSLSLCLYLEYLENDYSVRALIAEIQRVRFRFNGVFEISLDGNGDLITRDANYAYDSSGSIS